MRPYADADAEIALALMNQKLAPHLPTVLLVSQRQERVPVSSFVRQTAMLGGLIVPGSVSPAVEEALRERISQQQHSGSDGPPGSPSAAASGHTPAA